VPRYLTNVNGTLFFVADDGAAGFELWKSDGTEPGTSLVKDIYPGNNALDPRPRNLVNVNGTLFFTADDGATGEELWQSDGTDAGTVRVGDIVPGAATSYPFDLTNVGGRLFFTAFDPVHGRELWTLQTIGNPRGDLNLDGFIDAKDIDALFAAVNAGSTEPAFDLTGDALVNRDDVTYLVENILSTRAGDANLDGRVDRQDLAIATQNYGRNGTPSWSQGNFNGDAMVNLLDLLQLKQNYEPPAAPSPASPALSLPARRLATSKPAINVTPVSNPAAGEHSKPALRASRLTARTSVDTPVILEVGATSRTARRRT
jgi:ELWxxDGT repeat protein